MKEQTFLIEKLDSGFLVTTAGKQHAKQDLSNTLMFLTNSLGEIFLAIKKEENATSIEITISHKLHYKAAEPNDDNTGNHGV